jgi:hypothetical protein
MEINCRKLLTVLGVACLSAKLFAASASSNTSSSSSQMNNTDQSMMASGLMYAGPKLGEDSTGISLGADYILWQVVQEGLETFAGNYGSLSGPAFSPFQTFSPVQTQGQTTFPKFNLLNGFKVHGGVNIAESGNIDLFLQYIWLQRTTGTNTGTGGSQSDALLAVGLLNPNFFASGPTPFTYSVSFNTSYNVLDFEMGRLTSLCENSFTIRPFWGIRGVWNTNTYNVTVNYDIFSDGQEITQPYNLNSYQNTSGAGVRGGLNLTWQLFANSEYFGGLKIIGLSALSGVYGRTYVDSLVQGAFIPYSPEILTAFNNRTSLNRIIPVVDLSIGLSWDMSFGGERDNDYNVEIHALWETQSWIGYGRHVTSFIAPRGPQNLTVQGFTIGAQLMF